MLCLSRLVNFKLLFQCISNLIIEAYQSQSPQSLRPDENLINLKDEKLDVKYEDMNHLKR